MWVEVPELLVNCYRSLLTWRQGVNKSVDLPDTFCFLISSAME
jgi:hypothetical protein